MAVFDTPDTRFDLRTAGACLHEGRVLAQTTERMDFYVLPGGRVEYGEDSRSALKREMREELGSEVRIEDLLFIVENFFTPDRMKHHEILMIYAMHPEDLRLLTPDLNLRRTPPSEAEELIFHWLPLDSSGNSALKPDFLRERLKDPPRTPMHLIIRD